MSQHDLARRIGVRAKTVEQWEADASEPRANRLQMLAGMLSVSLTWLLTGEGEGVLAPDDSAATHPPIAELLTEMRQLQTEITQIAGRIGKIEKRLRQDFADTSLRDAEPATMVPEDAL
ncbi:MAG: helix-turn-helix domain-containing protein [Rhodobacteraceae bacterium]|nr:helix-turn-helix domain-containing protein [Paracoccaceae bacterium]